MSEDTFKSQMLKALYKLQHAQFALMNAQEESPPAGEKIEKAWSLLWANLRSCFMLVAVIRASVVESSTKTTPDPADTHPSIVPTPVVSPSSPEFTDLVDLIERSVRSVAQMRRHTARAYETLIHVGQGDSAWGHAVNLCRLYGDTVEGILETISKELHVVPPAAVVN
jgi:hypothetical protein